MITSQCEPCGVPYGEPETASTISPRRIVVGIGHDYRRDDAVGLVVARAVAARSEAGLVVCCLGEDILRLLEFMQPGAHIVIVDAVVSGAPAGTIHHIDLLRGSDGDAQSAGSSHVFGLGQVLALAHAMGCAPTVLRLVGVEAADLSLGSGLSPAVAASIAAAVAVARRLVMGDVNRA